MTLPAHSSLGASSMYRWSACPGSVRLAATVPPSVSSKYAAEGTEAHALLADCLEKGCNSGRWIGQPFHGFTVTQEMAEAVQVAIDYVDDHHSERDGTALHIEQRFDLSSVHAGCFGTADIVIWNPAEKLLIVADYKHGAGIPVKVEGNPQLQYYGLGALLACGYGARRVRLAVIQPRCEIDGEKIREWEIDAIDLLDFKADLKEYALATEKPGAPLVPGDHCRFCPAAAVCPALAARAQEMAKHDFTSLSAARTISGRHDADRGLGYDPEKLKLALDSREAVKAWLKSLDEFAYAEAEAGRCPPGYKLVAKRASRKWRDEHETIDFMQRNFRDAILREMFEPRALLSPAQMEKLLGKAEWPKVAEHAVAESSGHLLAPEGDKRPAVKVDAKSEFAAIE